ncbi:hypothetical protein QTN25_010477 [Entamoeba marina]
MELTTSPKTTSQPPTKEIDELPDVIAEPSQLIQDTENIKSKMEEEKQTEILNNEHLNEEKMVVEEPLSTEKEVQTNSKQSEPTHMEEVVEEVVEENKEKEQNIIPSPLDLKKTSKVSSPSTISDKRDVSPSLKTTTITSNIIHPIAEIKLPEDKETIKRREQSIIPKRKKTYSRLSGDKRQTVSKLIYDDVDSVSLLQVSPGETLGTNVRININRDIPQEELDKMENLTHINEEDIPHPKPRSSKQKEEKKPRRLTLDRSKAAAFKRGVTLLSRDLTNKSKSTLALNRPTEPLSVSILNPSLQIGNGIKRSKSKKFFNTKTGAIEEVFDLPDGHSVSSGITSNSVIITPFANTHSSILNNNDSVPAITIVGGGLNLNKDIFEQDVQDEVEMLNSNLKLSEMRLSRYSDKKPKKPKEKSIF